MRPGMIEVTGVPLEALVRAAYNPSRPQGLGLLHYQPGDLTDEEVAAIVDRGKNTVSGCVVNMDYVKGRSCKFTVYRKGDGLFISSDWFDHSDDQVRGLLTAVGLSPGLFDAARAAKHAHQDECTEAALTFLRERGGTYTKPKNEYETKAGMEKIEEGFYQAMARKLTKYDFTDAGQVWSLVA